MKAKEGWSGVLIALLMVTLMCAWQSQGAEPVTVQRVGGYPAAGITRDVQLRGDFAYVVGSAGLLILDISNPTNITLVASNANNARCLKVSDDVIYSGRISDVAIHQVINATNLLFKRATYGAASDAWAIDCAGSLVYACTVSGFLIEDGSLPFGQNKPLGTFPVFGYAVKVKGNLAYLASDSGLKILNVNIPTNVTLAGSVALGLCTGLDIVGGLVYLSGTNGLQILDASNPTNIVALGGYQTASYDGGVKVAGSFAYLAAGTALEILDVSSPTNVVRVARYDTQSKVYHLQIVENRIIVANGTKGVEILAGNGQTAPIFTLQPNSQSGLAGSNIYFYATVAGATPLAYQWYRDDTNALPDGTNTWLTLGNLPSASIGRYHLVVSNAYGMATSSVAKASMRLVEELNAPELVWNTYGPNPWVPETNITHDGISCAKSEFYGKSILETTVTGPGIVTYWWKVYAVKRDYISFAISGVIRDEIYSERGWKWRRSVVPPGPQVLTWAYEAKSGYKTNMGLLDEVAFTPIAVPTVFAHPQSKSALIGDATSLEVTAVGMEPMSYQWYAAGGQAMAGSTNATLAFTNVQPAQAGEYYVVISNAVGIATSAVVRLDMAYANGFQRVAAFAAGDFVYDVAVIGNLAYLAAASNGLIILDVSHPTNLVELGRYDTPGIARKISVVNNLAYVADSSGGLQILDISIPTNITWAGGFTNTAGVADLQMVGSMAVASDSARQTMLVLDVSQPTNVVQVSQYSIGSLILNYQLSGNVAYVATLIDGLRMFDISDPTNWVSIYADFIGGGNIYVTNNLAFTSGTNTLQIVDISNPLDPRRLGGIGGTSASRGLTVANSMAFVPVNGILVFDIRNPAGIQQVAFYPSPEFTIRVQVANGLIYVAEGNAGFSILRFAPIIGPPKVVAGLAQFSLSGLPDEGNLFLESSTNLIHWSPVRTNVITSPYYEYSEGVESNAPARYFRAVVK